MEGPDATGRVPRQVGMHSTCLFCHADLGANGVIECFPLGRRLAWDAARGRLWVVCPRCRGWNLTPLEERWEAIEECERSYRDAKRRVSTDNIGLAKLPEGLELVRIGQPQRPEFAAWRYGERLIIRRRKTMLQVGAGLGVLGAVVGGGIVAGIGIGGAWWGFQGIVNRIVRGSPNKIIARIPADGPRLIVRRKHLKHLKLVSAGDGVEMRVPGRYEFERGRHKGAPRLLTLTGLEAVRTSAMLLPSINRFGGSQASIRDAVTLLERDPDPTRFFTSMARARQPVDVQDLAVEARLALEMAAHEEIERRAMEGELAELEQAWVEAEEIAAIADDLLLPGSVRDWLTRMRGT